MKLLRARKEHKCEGCREAIKPGELYARTHQAFHYPKCWRKREKTSRAGKSSVAWARRAAKKAMRVPSARRLASFNYGRGFRR